MQAVNSKMNAKVSIIVPFFCTPEDLFARCINSLLSEKSLEIEVLVIDDGSSIEYRSYLRKYESDKRLRIIYASHAGVSAARNRGIKEASAHWVMFIDSDDYVDRDAFIKIMKEIDQYNGSIELFGGALDSKGHVFYNTTFLSEGNDYGKEMKEKIQIMESALSAGLLPVGYVQKFSYGSPYCKLFDREFLIENKLFFDESVKFAEDTLFSMYAYQCAKSIYYHNIDLYYYVDNAQSVTRKYRPGLSKDMDILFEKLKLFLEQSQLEKELQNAYYVRVQLEVKRAFSLEFFNINNKDRNVKRQYLQFISSEPYRTALTKHILPSKGIKNNIFNYIVRKGHGKVYRVLKSFMK